MSGIRWRNSHAVTPSSAHRSFFNTDQGTQFTSEEWIGRLKANHIAISMDGRGRCLDNVFIERLWRTVKYEEVYLRAYEDLRDAREHLKRYFDFYNDERPHRAHGGSTPSAAYYESLQEQYGLARVA